MTTLITGGTGFVGRKLIELLDDQVIVTSRDGERAKQKMGSSIADAISWQPTTEDLPLTDGHQVTSVINLMGESVAHGRWTAAKKKRIRESRVEGTRRLVDAILKLNDKPNVLVSASAVGYYGTCGNDVVDESYRRGEGFLADVCKEWEDEAMRLQEHGIRVVLVRIGLVMGGSGGALEKLIPLYKWGLGGRLGSGRQYWPWIHVEDLCRMIVWAAKNKNIAGPLNGTAPNPVTNREFTATLARLLNRPAILPAPKFGLRLVVGEFANSLFASQNVVPKAALDLGFDFEHDLLEDALADIIRE